jgi:type I site-specific restriction-modification system R (restriction) subunit
MEVNTVQTQVIAGLKDSVGKFTGMLKVKGDEKKPTTTVIKQNLENIAVEFKPQKKCEPVQQINRNPLSEMIKPINTPQQIAKTEKDRLRDKILSRIKNRRTSHQSSTSTLPD